MGQKTCAKTSGKEANYFLVFQSAEKIHFPWLNPSHPKEDKSWIDIALKLTAFVVDQVKW